MIQILPHSPTASPRGAVIERQSFQLTNVSSYAIPCRHFAATNYTQLAKKCREMKCEQEESLLWGLNTSGCQPETKKNIKVNVFNFSAQ